MKQSRLLEFGFKNYLSFKQGAQISFRLGACPEDIANGWSVSPVLCVKGANGSGKTTVLKAFTFVAYFCAHSFAREPDSPLALQPFFGSKEPCEFYVDFAVGEAEYRYELEATDEGVTRETIYRTVKRKSKLIERTANKVTAGAKSFHPLTTLKVRKNASIVSTARQYELDQLREVYEFFFDCRSNVNSDGFNERVFTIPVASRYLQHNSETLRFVTNFISECDVGVSEILIKEREAADGKKGFFPVFVHPAQGEDHEVAEGGESHGTKMLFRVLPLYANALKSGGVVTLDEFDAFLHPLILVKLVGLFLSLESNPHGAQLMFSTHATEVLNLLGRYRTYLVNKDANESYAYRLDEIPGDILRNDRPISPAYLEGKIGGIPRLP